MDCNPNETISYLDYVLKQFSQTETFKEREVSPIASLKGYSQKIICASTQTISLPCKNRCTQVECSSSAVASQITPTSSSKCTQTDDSYHNVLSLLKIFTEESNAKLDDFDKVMNAELNVMTKALKLIMQNINSTSGLLEKRTSDSLREKISLKIREFLLQEVEDRQKIELNQMEEKYDLHTEYFSLASKNLLLYPTLASDSFFPPTQLSLDSLLRHCKALLND